MCGSKPRTPHFLLYITHTVYFSPAAPKANPRRKVAKKAAVLATDASTRESVPIDVDEEEETPTETRQVDNSYMANMNSLFEEEAELYEWVPDLNEYNNSGIVTARFTQQTDADFVFWLSASNQTGFVLSHRISSEMNQRFSPKMHSLTWNYIGNDGSQRSWLLRFRNEEDYRRVIDIYTQCLWQTLHQVPWSKVKV